MPDARFIRIWPFLRFSGQQAGEVSIEFAETPGEETLADCVLVPQVEAGVVRAWYMVSREAAAPDPLAPHELKRLRERVAEIRDMAASRAASGLWMGKVSDPDHIMRECFEWTAERLSAALAEDGSDGH